MIRVEDVTLAPGGDPLLEGVSFHLRPGDKVGLVGRNGTGKTTLLRVLAGESSPADGRVLPRSGLRIGYLPQHAVSGSTATVWDEAKSGMTRLNQLRADLESAQAAVDAGEAGALERHGAASEAFRIAGGWSSDEKIGEVLHGLGFGPDTWHNSCDTFSGGWQMRIALARLLLSDPDVALLDEPTNHLDLHARTWLTGYLARASWAVVVVSHDRFLLDRAVGRIVEIVGGTIEVFAGNYASWRKERELRQAQRQAAYDTQQDEIRKLERFVERFGAKATKAAAARSRKKQLDRMDRVEAPTAEKRRARIRFAEGQASDLEAVVLRGVSAGYDGQPVFSNVDLVVERGMRLALVGPNGCGKSTLLHVMSGRLPLLAGRRRLGELTRPGVFSQDLAAELPGDQSALEYLSGQFPLLGPQRIRTVLGSLGLSGDAALRPIAALSGGERARVALGALCLRPHNVLFLDEPTNHLDIDTVEVLAEALSEFEGALVLVSHDRYFIERLATHVALFHDGSVELRIGLRDGDFDASTPQADDEGPSQGAVDYAERKKRARELERARRRVAELEDEIAAAEAEVARLEEALFASAADHERALALSQSQADAEARVAALFAEWESLEELLASV